MGFYGSIRWSALDHKADVNTWKAVVAEFQFLRANFGFVREFGAEERDYLQYQASKLSHDEKFALYEEVEDRAYARHFRASPIEEVGTLIEPLNLITGEFSTTDSDLREFDDYIRISIPPDVLGEATFGSVSICIGPNYTYVGGEDNFEPRPEDGFKPLCFFTTFQLSLHGSGSPLHWRACRKQILELPRVKSITERLERIVGKCRIDVGWS